MSPAEGRGALLCRYDIRVGGVFALTSLLAIGAGCVVSAWSGVPAAVWGRSVAAWAMGLVLAILLARIRPARLIQGVLLLAPLALLASLLDPGQFGVHRWIRMGPLNWNAAFIWLPVATVALAATAWTGLRWTGGIAIAIELVLCLQPDASQATAFAAAMMVTLLTTRFSGAARVAGCFFFALAAGFSWTRPDPLKPLPEVEGIVELARMLSPGAAVLCVASLAAASAAPLFALKGGRHAARALFVYFASYALMPLFGAFPVPLVGMGMSPILGFWLSIGVLMAVCSSGAAGLVESKRPQ